MPALSPTMEQGSLAEWKVKEGDSVAAGDVLADVETDKATMGACLQLRANQQHPCEITCTNASGTRHRACHCIHQHLLQISPAKNIL